MQGVQARTWAVVAVVAVLFSFGWTEYVNHRTEDKLAGTNGQLATRVDTLEEYVTLCREVPEECREVVPPVEEIEPPKPPAIPEATTVVVREPTLAEIRAATLPLLPELLEQNCGGSCVGEPGKDSEVPGPKGEDSQVPGPQGEQGPKGEPGRGITSVTCSGMTAPDTFTFTYSDGTSETVECEMLPPVEEEEP
jgi:hypothetical protein